jgi:DNA-binding MarR family transcriptional regulator
MNPYHLSYQLHRAGHAVAHAMDEQLRSLGITSTQVLVLIFIDRYPDVTGAQLANFSAVTPQTMHRTIIALEKRGLINRSRKTGNNKSSYISITSLGAKTLGEAEKRVRVVQDVAIDQLQPEEVQTLYDLLQKYESVFRNNKGGKI